MNNCTHHFEHVKQARPFTEREYMQCTKCGLQNPLGLFQHWDTHRDGHVPMPDFNRNSYVYRTSIPQHVWPKVPNIIDHLIDAFKQSFKPQPKRNPITKVRRISRRQNPFTGQTFSTWYWQCALCDHNLNPRDVGSTHYGEICFTWADAYRRANQHAQQHETR